MADLAETGVADFAKDSAPFRASHSLLGMKLTPMTQSDLLYVLQDRIAARRQCIIAYQNLHGMHLSYTDESIGRLHQRPNCLVYIDGFPIYLLCRLFGRSVQRRQRITGNDFIWPMLTLAEKKGWRVYFLGSKEEFTAAASVVVRRRNPSLTFRAHHGYFDPVTENEAVLEDIREFAPDLVIVSMGMPSQEEWIARNADALGSTSVCAMGAIVDYMSGTARVPPRWLGPIGLEWLFRLVDNPARFWHRYLVEPWLLLANVLIFVSKRQ